MFYFTKIVNQIFMAKNESLTVSQICNAAKNKKFAAVYILMGEEPYYIDYIAENLINNALTEDERDFNLSNFYGLDADVKVVISTCKRYPVMAERQVVIVREAQMMDNADMLQHYIKDPLKSTVLIICNKNGKLKAPETLKLAKASNCVVVFESKKLTESTVGSVINEYVAEKGIKIDPKSTAMMKDYVGTDISRLYSDIDKLAIIMKKGETITPEIIERNIGISKDYNNFELENAMRDRNAVKALKIVNYFEKNPKNNPVILTTALLFSLYSNLLLIHTSKDKSQQGLMNAIGTQSTYRLGIYLNAAKNYSASACFQAIGHLRNLDTKSKGIKSRQNEYELLRECILKILYTR